MAGRPKTRARKALQAAALGVTVEELPAPVPVGTLHRPFVEGNVAAVTHGATSERVVDARALEVREQLVSVAPWITEPHFADAVTRYCRAEARARLLHDFIVTVASEQGAGRVSIRLWESAATSDRLAAQLGNALGLDPSGYARLRALATTTDVARESLNELRKRGAKVRARREAEFEQEDVEAPQLDGGDVA